MNDTNTEVSNDEMTEASGEAASRLVPRTRIKMCGLTRARDVADAVAAGADALGFVFYRASPRYVTPAQAGRLMALVPPFVSTVALFVNASVAEVRAVLAEAPANLLQFHGDESAAQCWEIARAVSRPFIRTLHVGATTHPMDLLKYEHDYRAAGSGPWFQGLLLDAHTEAYGGAGKVFDWSVIPEELAPRVVLSGGLSAQNATEAVLSVRPFAVDVSSGIEQAKGIKDSTRMRDFVAAVRDADN